MQSARLTKIVSVIPTCDTLADVGCDHGYIGIATLQLKRAQNVCFVDVSQPSLDKARLNCPSGMKHCATFVCQDGLQQLQADCAVIAGMGGLEIISILQNTQHLPQYLVLQPMRNQRDVRSYIASNYQIVSDEKFFDGKYYDLIVAKLGKCTTELTQLELEFGKSNLTHPTQDFVNFLQLEHAKLSQILQGCNDQEVQAKLLLVNQAIQYISNKNYTSA